MEGFLKFLSKSKNFIHQSDIENCNITVVIGNESCDLDSTISTLALSYLLNSTNNEDNFIIPIMNVSSVYFPSRTETCYLLQQSGIDWKTCLIFFDEIDLQLIIENNNVQTYLVDHHVLSKNNKILEKTVVKIFDHRPFVSGIWDSNNVELIIKQVGSCSTLITNEILKVNETVLFKEFANLLYATIIFDTIGLNKNFGRTFDEDIQIITKLETILEFDATNRKLMFDKLWKIHNDTSNITTKQLLYRDLKIVENIPIPALPMLVETFLKHNDLLQAIESFSEELNTLIIILVGIDATIQVQRDIAIFYKDPIIKDFVLNSLKNCKETTGNDLILEQIPVDYDNILYFKQNNIKLTRKFLIPLINEAVTKFKNNK